MKIGLSVGHSILKSGENTSEDGTTMGGGNEYAFCSKFAPVLRKALEAKGHMVELIQLPEKTATDRLEERKLKIQAYNEQEYDFLLELHLNASNAPKSEGTEAQYVSDTGKKYAEAIARNLSTDSKTGLWKNRGAKRKTDPYFLNRTKAPAVLLKLFFCTNKSEWKRAQKNKQKMAQQIADAIESVN